MAISFDNALGIHLPALLVRGQRAEVLANNIANADTPNYKARDLDFKRILAAQSGQVEAAGDQTPAAKLSMAQTHDSHSAGIVNPALASELLYRTPLQPAIDGNTVDMQTEQADYARNALDFQTSFTFLNRKFSGLSKAIKGE